MDLLFTDLGKEYRKLSKNPIQIVVVGGAAIFAKYSFRIMSLDIDGMLLPFKSDALKHAINNVSDKNNIPRGWLNDDFIKTESFSHNIALYSNYYKTFSNIIEVRIISSPHLIAMKLMSFRPYKYDLSDIYGIIAEERKNNNPITKDQIISAIKDLYGDKNISDDATLFLNNIFANIDQIENRLEKTRVLENLNKAVIAESFNKLKNEDNKQKLINELLSRMKKEATK